VSAIATRLAPIEGDLKNAARRPQRKKRRRAVINLARTSVLVRGIGLAAVIPLRWGRRIAGLTDQSADSPYLRADAAPISAQINGRVMVLITEYVTLQEMPWITSMIHIARTVGWQRIGTLSQMLSSRLLEADVAARAATALIARTLQREAFVLACRDAFLLFGVMMLMSILAALCFRNPCSPEGCSNSLIERGPSMPIRTPSIVDDGRIRPRPIPTEVLQGE
jgi:hypothetical protein